MDDTAVFEAERPRLLRIAGRVLGDPVEAQDVVQQAWLRLHATATATATATDGDNGGATGGAAIENLPAWLTTVTTRLCLDTLRRRTSLPVESDHLDRAEQSPGPAEQIALADTVGVALQVVLDRLGPGERVAFVLHDSFGVDFPAIAAMLDTTPAAARQLASRARRKVALPTGRDAPADWEVVDAFLAAAREGEFGRLLELLAPGAVVAGDPVAVAAGTPERIEGRDAVAAMFDGAAKAALPVFVAGRPGAAWFHRGELRVAFDFTVEDGVITRIDLRAEPDALATVERRRDDSPV